jgi:hypothetical protein
LECELEMEIESELRSEFDEDESDMSMSSSSLSSLSSTDSSISSDISDSATDDDLDDEFADETEPEDYMDALSHMLPLVLSLIKRVVKPKSRDFVSHVLPLLDESDFKEQYRMFPDSFRRILAYIEDHPIFYTDSEIRPQESPQFQLQVALKRFGSEASSAASWSAISKQFGIGKGTVGDYTNRVTIALMSLWDRVISWKTDRQKREMRERLTNEGHAVY